MKNTIRIILILGMSMLLSACGHEHSFSEATCTEPKVCTECGEIEGEALGHTTDMGRCENCSTIINEELILEVAAKQQRANKYSDGAYSYLASGITYDGCLSSITQLKLVEKSITEMIELCEDYEFLKDVKSAGEDVLEYIPTSISGNSVDEMSNFATEFVLYLDSMRSLAVELQDVAKKLQ